MIAISRPRRRVGRALAVGFALLVPLGIIVAPREAKAPREEPVVWEIIPLSGSFSEDEECAAFVDELVQHPNWQLHVADRASACTGTWDNRRFVIDADGGVTWRAPDMPERHLTLTPDELQRVRELNRLDCERTEPVGYGEDFYELSWGEATDSGRYISGSSAMAGELDRILDAAIDRYTTARLASIGALRVELDARSLEHSDAWTRRTARFHLNLAGDGTLRVTRGRQVLHEDVLDARAQVDLIDTILAGQPTAGEEYDLARGSATIGARRVPLRVEGFSRVAGLAPLVSAIAYATVR